jgi:hypothetical protein
MVGVRLKPAGIVMFSLARLARVGGRYSDSTVTLRDLVGDVRFGP